MNLLPRTPPGMRVGDSKTGGFIPLKDESDKDGTLIHAVQTKNKYPYLVDAPVMILNAMFAISDPEKHPEFTGDTATVYSHPLSMGGASNSHYDGNAETYMNVGEAMGAAMVELLKDE